MTREQTIQRIAREKLRIETLETRGSDRLDFHDLGVTSLRDALIAAYEAGREASTPKRSKRSKND